MKRRSFRFSCVFSAFVFMVSIVLAGCGQSYYFGGRTLPPSGIANRVLIAIQNPSALTGGALQIVDAYYDIRHSYNNKVASFSISGFSGNLPQTIENFPEEQAGAVYSSGNYGYALINYAQEKQNTSSTLSGPASSILISNTQRYIFAALQSQHALMVEDLEGAAYDLNLPNVYRVSTNPSATVALAFVQNSNLVYSVLKLQNNQPAPANAEDCEPLNLPVYCVVPVPGTFDHPIKAVFSGDGTTAYVLNCGPECGGVQAGVTAIPTAGIIVQSGTAIPAGTNTAAAAPIPIPGGATDALDNGDFLYIAGQQLQSNGYFAGMLTVLNTSTGQISGPYSISDGNHTKMVLGDDNSLWIGSQLCSEGERYYQTQAGANIQIGCLTMFNTATNSVTIVDSYKGDATGIAAITGLGKVYTAEGGQVYIYSTVDGSALDNSNVTVVGTASDVAYMDAPSDTDNTDY